MRVRENEKARDGPRETYQRNRTHDYTRFVCATPVPLPPPVRSSRGVRDDGVGWCGRGVCRTPDKLPSNTRFYREFRTASETCFLLQYGVYVIRIIYIFRRRLANYF